MECKAQSHYYTEYQFHKNHTVDTKANNNYQQYCKRAYHKSRRRYDKILIENQINELAEADALLSELFKLDYNRFCFF